MIRVVYQDDMYLFSHVQKRSRLPKYDINVLIFLRQKATYHKNFLIMTFWKQKLKLLWSEH
jgi:hypothetical protein